MPMNISEARKVLGVTKDSSSDTIKYSYRSKVLLCHPDITGKKNHDEFDKLTTAYNTIKKTNKSLEAIDCEAIFDFFNNPRSFTTFYAKFIESFQPKKLEDLVSKLSMQKYDEARTIYNNDPTNALKYTDNIKVALQTNISYKYNSNLSKHLDELSFYCNNLKLDYKQVVTEVSHAVLFNLEKELSEKYHSYTTFESFLEKKFSLIDKIPLDTRKLEDTFKERVITDVLKDFNNSYRLKDIKSNLDKLAILDEYYSANEEPNQLIMESYQKFVNRWNNNLVPKPDRKFVSSVLIDYSSRGIIKAKEALKYFRITHKISDI